MENWIVQHRYHITIEVIAIITGKRNIPDFCHKMDFALCKMMYKIEFHNYAWFNPKVVGAISIFLDYERSESMTSLR